MLPQRMRTILKRLLRAGRQAPTDRSNALQREINFWRDWLLTGGLDWPYEFRERFDPDHPIQPYVKTYIDRLDTEYVRILDVGAGPLTKLGKTHPSKQLEITATDLLAKEYDRLFKEVGKMPPVRTVYADAERLLEQFGQDAFDIVHGMNSIDHMVNPLQAIEQMIAVSKPSGYVVLYHAENEGQREQYQQLHQWDFTCEKGAFIIRDRNGGEANVTQRLAPLCEVECMRIGNFPEAESDETNQLAAFCEAGYDVAILTWIRKLAN